MWSTIANFRENLSQIASDVLDTAEELETGGSRHGSLDDLEFLAVRRQQQDAKHQDELLMLREENKILKKKMALLVAERVPLLNGDVKKQHEFQESTEDFNNGLHTRNQNENDGQQVGRRHNMSGSGGHQQPYSEASGDQMSNGITSLGRFQQLELQVRKLQDIEKDLSTQISEKNQKYALLKDAHDLSLTEIKTLKEVLEKERADLANTKLQLQREQKAVEALENESKRWKMEKRKMSLEIAELQKRSEEQTASNEHTISYLQSELRKKTGESFAGNNEKMEQLQKTIDRLENEKCELQVEIENLLQRQSQDLRSPRVEEKKANGLSHEELNKEAEGFKEAEVAFDVKRREIEVRFDDIRAERDKALRDLSRLKQHLLEKEQADSEKMDQDCEHIAELEAKAEASNARVLQLEQTVSQMLAYQAAVHKENNEILQKNNEEIASLKQRLSSCIAVLESKDVELLNLQTVLGQYYAESEAKDRLLGELNVTKKEISLLSEKLKVANRNMELKNKEKEDVVASLTSQERKVIESQQKTSKLEEEVLMLRRALEQSLTRLNRMSSDSDYYVDRRIVIKLLVTYFQRHHSKEVLDLMVRMLGFSEEDKQAIGLAQQGAGKGVVRGVLGLPGRFVGGLLKNGSPESSSGLLQTGNQSFADLWIDFLLKESEERERRDMTVEVKLESGKQTVASTSPANRSQESSPVHSARGAPLLTSQPGSSSYVAEPVNRTLFSSDLNDTAGGEFSTVPLNSTPSPKASSLRQWRTNIHL